MMPDICPQCKKPLTTVLQRTMLGVPEFCQACEEKRQVAHMLAMLPEEEDDAPERDQLTNWENNFLDSVRDQFEKKGQLSGKQFEVLERIYLKLR
jgi:hypothetical protein